MGVSRAELSRALAGGGGKPVYEEDPDTQACTPRLAHGGLAASRLGQTGWVRGQRAGGGAWGGQAASPSPVQCPCAFPHAPYILPSSDRMILRRPQGG